MIFASWNNHPELNWETIETEHFLIHFHMETKRSAEEAALVAEKIYKPVTSYYEFEPDSKTHIIIKDVDDYSNGAAYYYDNKIIIWALPMDYELRGSHRWLNNVITHEFVHIVQIGAAMKYPRRFPAAFIQNLNYENEKRTDVLYGYPNAMISYPIPGVSVPPWLAEGTAQFMYPGANFDFWDSHRDMIVRERILNGNLLSFDAMNSFGKRGIGNESAYNQGFLFSGWLVNKFGKDILKKITQSLSKPYNYSINFAIKEVTGERGDVLYNLWKEELEKYYKENTKIIIDNELKGKVLIEGNTTNLHPVWSPNEDRFAYLSNKEHDSFGKTDLYYFDFSDSIEYKIANSVHSAPSWINDSTIIYTKRSKANKWGSRYFDLYSYSFIEKDEKRLSKNLRSVSPTYNKETNQIAAVTSYDGTSNIILANNVNKIDGDLEFEQITSFNNGLQIFSTMWFDNEIYIDAVMHQGRNIFKLDMISRELIPVIEEKWDSRDQESYKGDLIFSNNRSGIFNLAIQKNGSINYITNVTGGAFMPSISKKNKILYSLYENGEYKICILDSIIFVQDKFVGYDIDYYKVFPESELILSEPQESRAYKESMLSMSIVPKLMIDYNTVKPGFYFFSSEVINRFSIFGGASSNSIWDIDAFLMIEYMKYYPTFYTNLYWITRNQSADRKDPFLYPRTNGTVNDSIHIFNDLSFNLFSGDVGVRFPLGAHKLKVQFNYSNYRQHVVQNVYQYWYYNNKLNKEHAHGELGFDYYRGKSLSLIYNLDLRKRSYAMNMLPDNGMEIESHISYEWNQFMDGFSVSEEHSTFGANFIPHNTLRFNGRIAKHFTLNKKNKLVTSVSCISGGLSNANVDDFFHFFGGGLPGIKGYTFYDSTLTGPFYFIATMAVRMPLFLEKDYSILHLNIKNMSLGAIIQYGAVSQDDYKDLFFGTEHKASGGIEYRIKGFSFFSYPTAIAYEYHRPITDQNEVGKHYFSLLFDYL